VADSKLLARLSSEVIAADSLSSEVTVADSKLRRYFGRL